MNCGLKGEAACAGLKRGFAIVVAGSKIWPTRTQSPVGFPSGPNSGIGWPPDTAQAPSAEEKSPDRNAVGGTNVWLALSVS